jgi:hypothetical protein
MVRESIENVADGERRQGLEIGQSDFHDRRVCIVIFVSFLRCHFFAILNPGALGAGAGVATTAREGTFSDIAARIRRLLHALPTPRTPGTPKTRISDCMEPSESS